MVKHIGIEGEHRRCQIHGIVTYDVVIVLEVGNHLIIGITQTLILGEHAVTTISSLDNNCTVSVGRPSSPMTDLQQK